MICGNREGCELEGERRGREGRKEKGKKERGEMKGMKGGGRGESERGEVREKREVRGEGRFKGVIRELTGM